MEAITLNNLAIGQKATIIAVGGEGILRRRFLDMGLTPKTRVMVRKRAPLGDPIMTLKKLPCSRRKHETYICTCRKPELRQKHAF